MKQSIIRIKKEQIKRWNAQNKLDIVSRDIVGKPHFEADFVPSTEPVYEATSLTKGITIYTPTGDTQPLGTDKYAVQTVPRNKSPYWVHKAWRGNGYKTWWAVERDGRHLLWIPITKSTQTASEAFEVFKGRRPMPTVEKPDWFNIDLQK